MTGGESNWHGMDGQGILVGRIAEVAEISAPGGIACEIGFGC